MSKISPLYANLIPKGLTADIGVSQCQALKCPRVQPSTISLHPERGASHPARYTVSIRERHSQLWAERDNGCSTIISERDEIL